MIRFDESKHKRGNAKNKGQFSSTGGGGGSPASKTPSPSASKGPSSPSNASGGSGQASGYDLAGEGPEGHAKSISHMIQNKHTVTRKQVLSLIKKLQALSPKQLKQVQAHYEVFKQHEEPAEVWAKRQGLPSHEEMAAEDSKKSSAAQPLGSPEEMQAAGDAYVKREEQSAKIRTKLAGMTEDQLGQLEQKYKAMPESPKSQRALEFIKDAQDHHKARKEVSDTFRKDREHNAAIQNQPQPPQPGLLSKLKAVGNRAGNAIGATRSAFDQANRHPLQTLKGVDLRSAGKKVHSILSATNRASPLLDKILRFQKESDMPSLRALTEAQRQEIASKYQRRQDELAARTDQEIDKLAKERARSFMITSDMDQSTVVDSQGQKHLQYAKNAPPAPEALPPKIEVHVHPEIKVEIPPIQFPVMPAFPEIVIPPMPQPIFNATFAAPEQQDMDLIPVRGEDGKVTRYKKVYHKKGE